MSVKYKYFLSLIIVLCFCSVSFAAAVNDSHQQKDTASKTIAETTFLRAKEGYTGDQLGAEVKKVSVDQEAEVRLVEVHIPYDPDRVDNIQIITESGKPLNRDSIAEVLNDYENDNIGIKFYLPRQKNWVFKVKLVDDTYEH